MIKTVIVDDEIKSILLLKKLLAEYCTNVEVVGEAQSIAEGTRLIREKRPQLLFLDVELNEGTGFELLQQFDNPSFFIIFVTAHSNYAVRAFKFSATDYILKPVDADDLVKTVSKVNRLVRQDPYPQQDENDFFHVKTAKGILYIKKQDITRVEGEGSYSVLFVNDGKSYIISQNLGSVEEKLPARDFLRVHKSTIINLNCIKNFLSTNTSEVEMKDGSLVQVSRRSRSVLKERFRMH